MTGDTSLHGRCLCGEVTFAIEGRPRWVGHCHCESCRRNCAAPFTTFVGVFRDKARWTGAAPKAYRSSDGVERLFCAACGTPMAYQSERWADEIHFYAAGLDDAEAVSPKFHVHVAEQLSWVHLADDLPRHEGTTK